MPKFAANLSMLFTEVPFMERFALAHQAGFSFVEYLFPYDYPVDALQTQLKNNVLKQVLFNIPSGNWSQGERGIAALPKRQEEFRAGVARAVEYAKALGVSQVNCQAGKKDSRYSDQEHWSTLLENVKYAADVLEKAQMKLLVEPINHFDIPGFYLNKTVQVLNLLEEVGMPNVFVQYDVYHAQREEGELAATLRSHMSRIGHIQIADNPGRHQPGTGEINYPFIFREIDRLEYQGYIGLEYIPAPDSSKSLSWIKEFNYHL